MIELVLIVLFTGYIMMLLYILIGVSNGEYTLSRLTMNLAILHAIAFSVVMLAEYQPECSGIYNNNEDNIMEFKVVKKVVLPLKKVEDDKTIYFKVLSEIFTGKEIAAKQGEASKKPARLMNIVDLETGEEMQIIMNVVLESILNENYADNAYINKCFMVTRHAKEKGKSYNTFSVDEIEEPKAKK